MTPLVAALGQLGSLVEARGSVRGALCDWHLVVSDVRVNPHLREVSRRLRLGADTATALGPLNAFDSDGAAIRRVIMSHATHGGSLATSLRAVAADIEERDRIAHESRAASAAARLSGRLLAALAIGSLILISTWRDAPLGSVVTSSVIASLLAACGTAWMRRLQPDVPGGDHPVAALADLVAGLMAGGMSAGVALEVACTGEIDMPSVIRRVRLGMSWTASLAMSPDPALGSLGTTLRRALDSGLPVREALMGVAADLREQRRRECAIQARRAPVMLVLPLTLCFLPAFGLVMVVPLLRAVTG